MLSDAFEEAFYQLDQDRDGVITVRDLERYSKEKNLKDKFIQKWLNLFADDRNIIYYDTFCVTLGIVPAKERFQNKIYKTDMTDDTQKFVIETISNIKENDETLTKKSLSQIIEVIESQKGGKWDIILNPTVNIVDVKYGNDGLLYYNISSSEDIDVLVYRLPDSLNERPQPKIHKADMSVKTQKSVMKIYASIQNEETFLSDENREKINNEIAIHNGGTWDIRLNPDENDLDVRYENDGLLYYSPNELEEINILIWKIPEERESSEIIYECDLSNPVKEGVLKSFYENYYENQTTEVVNSKILSELNENYGETWNLRINPTEKQAKVDYDFEGKIYFSPNSTEDVKVLIWREDKDKRRGSLCCGCF